MIVINLDSKLEWLLISGQDLNVLQIYVEYVTLFHDQCAVNLSIRWVLLFLWIEIWFFLHHLVIYSSSVDDFLISFENWLFSHKSALKSESTHHNKEIWYVNTLLYWKWESHLSSSLYIVKSHVFFVFKNLKTRKKRSKLILYDNWSL